MDNMVRDKIVFSIKEKPLKERLLREDNPTLQKVKDLFLAFEVTQIEIKKMNKAGTMMIGNDQSRSVAPLQQVKKKKFAPEPSKRICKQCGSEHRSRQCPAYGKMCHKCKGKNHFATVCRSGQKNKTPHKTKVHEVEIGREEEEQHFWVGELETGKGKRWSVKAFGNTKIENEGTATVPISVGEKQIRTEIFVTKGQTTPILGLQACMKLILIQKGKNGQHIQANAIDLVKKEKTNKRPNPLTKQD
ncbi:retrovirus-related pol polyprotein from transposon 17.6 [Plakobranchus ocellatus]|uniref:Retrovirus-related pol polyprotein from transposon 17.6 n=1 Tax=Plakobranchus ocellatus TaxID=259542 RepID=A0AAV4C4D9_9GAST|nr:retrovirus-related pol polyprotein from transposon 17.6 [Plakobranchus ocellatus]